MAILDFEQTLASMVAKIRSDRKWDDDDLETLTEAVLWLIKAGKERNAKAPPSSQQLENMFNPPTTPDSPYP